MKESEPIPDHLSRIPSVCARSFFSCTLSQRHRARRSWTTAAMTVLLGLTLTGVLLCTQAGFAVFLNGRQVGSARSMQDVTAVVTGAEKELKEILGYDYPLAGAISVAADLGVKPDDTGTLQKAIVGGIEGVAMLYVLEVNGETAGASADQKVLDDILGDILSAYATDATTSIRFTDTVTISRSYVASTVAKDPAEIRRLLEPSNTASPFKLTVESTEVRQQTVPVPYDTLYRDDGTAYVGSSVVITKGVAGESLVTEKTVLINGLKRSDETVGKELTKAPVAEIVSVGTLARPKTASCGTYIWPTEGVVTSGFGPRTGFGSSNHQGIDIGGDYGENIVASDGGTVTFAGRCSGYGLLVELTHDNGDVTYYGHCSELLVKEGEKVAQGQVIAHMGMTGQANGVHVHFEIRKNGKPVNPAKYLP